MMSGERLETNRIWLSTAVCAGLKPAATAGETWGCARVCVPLRDSACRSAGAVCVRFLPKSCPNTWRVTARFEKRIFAGTRPDRSSRLGPRRAILGVLRVALGSGPDPVTERDQVESGRDPQALDIPARARRVPSPERVDAGQAHGDHRHPDMGRRTADRCGGPQVCAERAGRAVSPTLTCSSGARCGAGSVGRR